MALEERWGAGTAPLLVIQGLDDEAAPPGNGHALREQFGDRVRVIDLPRAGHFLLLEQPEAVTRDRKSKRLNSSHLGISYAVFCLKKKNKNMQVKYTQKPNN